MKRLILAFMLLTTSCSAMRFGPKHKGFNPEFNEWKKQFIYDSRGKVIESDFDGVTLGFVDIPKGDSTVGICWPMAFYTEIDINEKAWKRHYSHLWRKQLIYHEFAHCILGRNHTEITTSKTWTGFLERLAFKVGWWTPKGYLEDGCPASLMHPEMLDDSCFSQHHDYYLAELFVNTPVKERDYVQLFQKEAKPKTCKEPEVVNRTDTWTQGDQNTLVRAGKTCVNTYNSCLKKLIKTEELAYQAICGNNYADRY